MAEGVEFITKTLALVAEERADARTRELWLTLLPRMTKANFVSYEDFRGRVQGAAVSVSQTPAEVTLERVRRIREAETLKTQPT